MHGNRVNFNITLSERDANLLMALVINTLQLTRTNIKEEEGVYNCNARIAYSNSLTTILDSLNSSKEYV